MYIVEPLDITPDDNKMVYSSLPEDDVAAAEWLYTTNFVVGNLTRLLSTHRVYKCLVNNSNKRPDLYLTGDTPHWVEVGATTRYKPFDGKVTDLAVSTTDTIQYTLAPGLMDSITFLNLDATSVYIKMYAAGEFDAVYEKTFNLISTENVTDAYSYCFNPIVRKTALAITDLPPYQSTTVLITITNEGGTAKVGEIVMGKLTYIGQAEYSPSASINNFSKKDVDEFGNFTIVKRAYSRKLRCSVVVPNSIVGEVDRLLIKYKDIPLLWITTEQLSMLIVYGFYKNFDIVVAYPSHSNCALEIEGLT